MSDCLDLPSFGEDHRALARDLDALARENFPGDRGLVPGPAVGRFYREIRPCATTRAPPGRRR